MPLSAYMIVLPPTVAILPSGQSINGISGFKSAGAMFGSVHRINDSCYKINEGDAVGFNVTDAMLVTIAGDTFYLVDQANVKFKQIPLS